MIPFQLQLNLSNPRILCVRNFLGSKNGCWCTSFDRMLGDHRYHRKDWQAENDLDIVFGSHRSILNFQKECNTESQHQAGAKSSTGKQRQFRERRRIRQVSGI
jgi:hypothetical protein